jgi:ElaB/YqjD/DUF883 family membrane-anchored ribosome-binding protein
MNSPESNFSDRMQETVSGNGEAIGSDIEATVEDAATTASRDIRAEAEHMIAQSREMATAATQYVRDNPLRSVGIAVAVGLVAGLFSRRSH